MSSPRKNNPSIPLSPHSTASRYPFASYSSPQSSYFPPSPAWSPSGFVSYGFSRLAQPQRHTLNHDVIPFPYHSQPFSPVSPSHHPISPLPAEFGGKSPQFCGGDGYGQQASTALATPAPTLHSSQPSAVSFAFRIPFILPPPPPLVQPPSRIPVNAWLPMTLSDPSRPISAEAWLNEARYRRAAYAQSFALPSLRWVLVEEGEPIPEGAVQTGIEATGEPLYSIRAWHNGGLHLGKGGHHIFRGGSISWGSQEHAFGTFEVLVGDFHLARWVSVPSSPIADATGSSGAFSPLTLSPLAAPAALPTLVAAKTISTSSAADAFANAFRRRSRSQQRLKIRPFLAIEGGFEPMASPSLDGAPTERESTLLFIAQAYYAGGWHPGKVDPGADHCCVGWGGGEVWVKDFRVLSWAF